MGDFCQGPIQVVGAQHTIENGTQWRNLRERCRRLYPASSSRGTRLRTSLITTWMVRFGSRLPGPRNIAFASLCKAALKTWIGQHFILLDYFQDGASCGNTSFENFAFTMSRINVFAETVMTHELKLQKHYLTAFFQLRIGNVHGSAY